MRTSGTLLVSVINGRHGPFNVAKLITSFGEFVIKDSRIEQFHAGEYEGEFFLSNIYPGSYCAGGRLVVEVRALLGEITFNDNGHAAQGEEPSFHTDPLDEESPVAVDPIPDSLPEPLPSKIVKKADSKARTYSVPQFSADAEVEDDELLFAEYWPLSDSVKLDPTQPRELLRKQAARLNVLGYEFTATTQTFNK